MSGLAASQPQLRPSASRSRPRLSRVDRSVILRSGRTATTCTSPLERSPIAKPTTISSCWHNQPRTCVAWSGSCGLRYVVGFQAFQSDRVLERRCPHASATTSSYHFSISQRLRSVICLPLDIGHPACVPHLTSVRCIQRPESQVLHRTAGCSISLKHPAAMGLWRHHGLNQQRADAP